GTRGGILRDGFAFLLFQGCDHLLHAIVFATWREDFQTLFLRTPLQNVDIDIADTPVSYLSPASLIKVDSVGANQRVTVIVNHVFFARVREAKTRPKRISRPI